MPGEWSNLGSLVQLELWVHEGHGNQLRGHDWAGSPAGVLIGECVLHGATGRVPTERHCRGRGNPELEVLPSLRSSGLSPLGKQNNLGMWDPLLGARKMDPQKLRREGGHRFYQPNWAKGNTSNYSRTTVVHGDRPCREVSACMWHTCLAPAFWPETE